MNWIRNMSSNKVTTIEMETPSPLHFEENEKVNIRRLTQKQKAPSFETL